MVDWFSVCEIEMEWYDGPEERKEKNYELIGTFLWKRSVWRVSAVVTVGFVKVRGCV